MRRPRRPRGAVVLLCVAAIAGLAGCGGSQPHPTLAELHAVPGADLRYPGAIQLNRLEQDSAGGIDGPSPAMITIDGCAEASEPELISWYGGQLAKIGWHAEQGITGVPDPGEYTADHGWRMGARRFDLLLDTPAHTAQLAARNGASAGCGQGYRTTLQ